MRPRLLVLDLDGTVLGPDLAVSPRLRRALRRVRRRGLAVGIASGRRPAMTARFAAEIGAEAPLVASDGAYVFTREAVLAVRPLPAVLAAEIFVRARYRGLRVVVYTPRVDFSNVPRDLSAYLSFALRHRHFLKPRALGNLLFDITRPRRLVAHPEEVAGIPHPILKVIPAGEPAELRKLREELQLVLGDGVRFTRPPEEPLEIVAPGVTKAEGLETVAAHLGITAAEVVAVGDGWNDESMLRWAGMGVAMGNAPEGLRRQADLVIGRAEADGLARFLEELAADLGPETEGRER